MSDVDTTSATPIRTRTIADREYELHRRRCENCGDWHYRIYRWCGTTFASYLMPPDFGVDHFEMFVSSLDLVLVIDAPGIFAEFQKDLDDVNSQAGIAADNSYCFRIMEYGRQRASILNEMNLIPAIANPEEPETPMGRAVRAAFEFGSAAAEHRFMAVYEEYVNAGIEQEEWRFAGLPKSARGTLAALQTRRSG